MLDALREFFDRHIAPGSAVPAADDGHAVRLATAALLVEVVRIDSDTVPAEREAVLQAVREKFDLPHDEAEQLFALAEQEVRQATDYYQFTSLINRQFTQQQKQRVIELMWRVAYADAEISAHEKHLMRKVAALLHIADGDYIAAKMRAQATRSA